MNRKKRIFDMLSSFFVETKIEVIDNSIEHNGHNNFDGSQESHFQISIKFKSSKNYSRLEIHKKINLLLKDEFKNGLHALEIKLFH
jgi:BolA family transcriptional regulator, general stress-responsive regulator